MHAPRESVGERLAGNARIQRLPYPGIELFQYRDFIDARACRDFIAMIDADRRPSTIADPNGDDYFRTSETCDLDPAHPAVEAVEQAFFALGGIDPAFGEPLQGQRYDVGQEFKPHTDYFQPDGADYDKYCAVSGQRTWTFMVYLNAVEAGGATRFKRIGKTFQPETGKLVCWNNRLPDGGVNPATIHHGMKVRKGVKYIITKWYREKEWPW
ncbi:prolyl hydroxylase family protein [Qipengyuania nanhaisediminis]|uniref:prolyl hydroxylase family protein n=1 Tax=Qipengyuania nanhaisediminis TaxID=604088 RepID=UPI0038B276BA